MLGVSAMLGHDCKHITKSQMTLTDAWRIIAVRIHVVVFPGKRFCVLNELCCGSVFGWVQQSLPEINRC